eukprot:COSAG01_NODE_23377_length_817_cov_3.992358_3_plen_22_part_01
MQLQAVAAEWQSGSHGAMAAVV